MQIVSWLNEFDITIIELKDSEITLGYRNESPYWTFLNHILILGLHSRDEAAMLVHKTMAKCRSRFA